MANKKFEIMINGTTKDVATLTIEDRKNIINSVASDELRGYGVRLFDIAEETKKNARTLAEICSSTRALYDSKEFKSEYKIEDYVSASVGYGVKKSSISEYAKAVKKFKHYNNGIIWDTLTPTHCVKLSSDDFELDKIEAILDELAITPVSKVKEVYYAHYNVQSVENTTKEGETKEGETTENEAIDGERPTDPKWVKWISDNLLYIMDKDTQADIKASLKWVTRK